MQLIKRTIQCIAICALLAPAAAQAEPQCEQVCNPSSSCGKLCWYEGFKMTCGQFNVCNAPPPPPPPCTPNWQQVSSTPSGYVHYNDYLPFSTCRVFRMNEILEHDLNQCNPQHLTRQRCVPQIWQEYGGCCYLGCTPQIQDESWCETF